MAQAHPEQAPGSLNGESEGKPDPGRNTGVNWVGCAQYAYLSKADNLWLIGNILSLIVGIAVGYEYGVMLGLFVTFLLSLLVDIRAGVSR
jgi:hypothetical protein